VACHACQLEAGNAAEADALKSAIARLAAGCNSTGNTLAGGPTSELSTATAAPKPATPSPSAPADAVVDAASPSPSDGAAAPSGSGAAAAPSGSGAEAPSSAAPTPSAPATTPTSGAMGRAAPVLAGVVGVAAALLA
jgi:translation initiation factor IF-2